MTVKQKLPNRTAPRRVPLTKADRAFVYQRDQGVCGICRKQILPGQLSTVDHIKPVSHGGSNIPSNWRLAHKSCNQGRGNRAQRTPNGGYVR